MYSYEEALESSTEYFGKNELAAKIHLDKYALRNNKNEILEKTPDNMHKRIAREFARIEAAKFKKPLSEDEIYSYLRSFRKIIPQGSPMAGIGNPYQYLSLSNCYVLTQPEDSYSGILFTDEEVVNISKRRGGVGISLDKLRPKDTPTQNAARHSTGIVSWMKRYSNTIREVGQAGRRGAMMQTLNVHHPDIADFIKAKANLDDVTGANVSVQYTDEFLKAVDNDEEYEQRWPVDSKNPTISKKVRARDIWELVVHHSWLSGEPGLQFWSNILRDSIPNCYKEFGFEDITSNPCVTGDTKILIKSKNGKSIRRRIDSLVGKKVEVWNGWEWSETEIKITGTNQPILKITTSTGNSLKCTYNHSFIIADGKTSRIAAHDLKIGDNLQDGNQFTNSGKVIKIEDAGIAEIVFCFTEFKRNSGVFNDILTGQCSELILCALDSCRLLLLNLFAYVKHPFTNKSYFDDDEFYKDAQIAQRLMDDLVDLELECIDRIIQKIEQDPESLEIKERELNMWKKIKDRCEQGRRTGTGITALADTLAAIGIKYGSKKSIEETAKIYKTLKLGCYRASVDIAKELGAFPVWDHNLEKDNPFLLRIKDEDPALYKDMKKYGRRNIALLTTAPTGSVSPMACLSEEEQIYGTSYAIEPVFMESYIKKKKGNPGDQDFRTDSVDNMGDHWMHFDVYHNGIKLWQKINPGLSIDKNPYRGCCAEEIDWQNRVKLQAAAQQHIDHSISSTINLPEDVKEEEVNKIFLTAWKAGCKGITVYRKNCRAGVMVEKEQEKNEKRPKKLPCEIYHVTVDGKPHSVFLGLNDGKPYEVFASLNGDIDDKTKTGEIVKVRKGRYKAILDNNDKDEICPINQLGDPNLDALTRMISTALQAEASTEKIAERLNSTQGPLTSFSKAIARALKRHVKDGTQSEDMCPDCKVPLIYSEGCVRCSNCGMSKC